MLVGQLVSDTEMVEVCHSSAVTHFVPSGILDFFPYTDVIPLRGNNMRERELVTTSSLPLLSTEA